MSLPEWRERMETYFAYNPADETQLAEGAEFIEGSPYTESIQGKNADERLARRVEFELFATKAFNMESLFVTAKNGKITLLGTVDSRAEAILAENTAAAVEGVTEVSNNLKVSKVA